MAGDAQYSNVSLLLHGNGADGSTTIADNSPSPKTASVYGSARIATAQSKWGGSSLYFDGLASYLRYASDSAFEFGSGDFTVELWARRGVINSEQVLITYGPQDQSTAYAPLLLIRFNSNNTVQAYCNTSVTESAVFGNCASSATFSSTSTWYHIAYVRSGSSFYLFVDGTQVATASSANTQGSGGSSNLYVGRDCRTNAFYFYGYQDDVRITKSVARYTAAFTPPTEEFPDSSGVSGIVGTASTTVTLSSAGAGVVSLSGIGAATVSVTSAAAGATAIAASASATVGATSAAAGSIAVQGQASTSVLVTSVAEGQLTLVEAELSGSTVVEVSAVADGTVLVQGAASAAVSITSAAEGVLRIGAELVGTTVVDVGSAALGSVEVAGQGSATVLVSSESTASAPAMGVASSLVSVASSATGASTVAGASIVTVQVLSSSAGKVLVEGQAHTTVSVGSSAFVRNGARNFAGDVSVVTVLRAISARTAVHGIAAKTAKRQVSVSA